MIQQDSGLKMLALGVGVDIDEQFLKKLCKQANRNVEIMNKGYSQPINYYQKVENPTQLMKIFQDISKGLKESNMIIVYEINFLEKQIGINEQLFEKFKSERKIFMDEEEQKNRRKDQRKNHFHRVLLSNKNKKTQELNEKLIESSRKLTRIGVFNKLRIKKMKNIDDLENILQRIDEFDYENLKENDTDDFEIDQESQFDEDEKNNQKENKELLNSSQISTTKKQKKNKPIDSSEVDLIKEKIEKLSKQKFKLGLKHLDQKDQLQKIYQSIEQTFTSIIENASKEYKDHQISQLESFIKEVLIKQIDELLQFN